MTWTIVIVCLGGIAVVVVALFLMWLGSKVDDNYPGYW